MTSAIKREAFRADEIAEVFTLWRWRNVYARVRVYGAWDHPDKSKNAERIAEAALVASGHRGAVFLGLFMGERCAPFESVVTVDTPFEKRGEAQVKSSATSREVQSQYVIAIAAALQQCNQAIGHLHDALGAKTEKACSAFCSAAKQNAEEMLKMLKKLEETS